MVVKSKKRNHNAVSKKKHIKLKKGDKKAGSKKLEQESKMARNKIRQFNKFIKTAKKSNQKQLELQSRIVFR